MLRGERREIEDNSHCSALDAREAAATSKPFAPLALSVSFSPAPLSLFLFLPFSLVLTEAPSSNESLAVNELPFGSRNVLAV